MRGEGNGSPLQYSCLENPVDGGAWWAAVHWVTTSRTGLSDFTFTFHFHTLEKEMATHSSVLAWRIPGTGEPGELPSVGSHRVRRGWSDLAAAAADHEGQWPVTKTQLAHLEERNFNKQAESSEMSKVLIRRKHVFVDRHTHGWDRHTWVGSEREPHLSLNHLYGAVLPGFLWPVILLRLTPSTCDLTQGPPLWACASFSQDGFQRKGFWEEAYVMARCPSLPWTPVNRSVRVGWKISLTLRMRSM